MLPAFLATLLFSVSAVSANRSTRFLGGTTANFARLFVATLLLGLWAHTLGSGLASAGAAWFVVSGCIGFGLGDLALFQALPRLGSRLTLLLVQCLAAPIGALAEWLWLGTTLGVAEILCGSTILIGVATALVPEARPNEACLTSAPGVVFGVLAAAGQAGGAVLSRKAYEVVGAAGESIDGITAAYQRILGGLAVAAVGWWMVKRARNPRETPPRHLSKAEEDPRTRWRRAWGWVLVNAIAGPALGVSCYQWALETTPTGIVLAIVATTPLVVIPFAVTFEGEQPRARSLIGGVIAVLGAIGLTLVA